jgi:hypothetical protein
VQPRPIIQKLSSAQETFLRAADSVSAQDWLKRPRAGCWSAGHVVAHLCLVERGTLALADRIIQKQAKPRPFYTRIHLPIAMVESRVVKITSPEIVAPTDELGGKEIMIAELRSVRERTLAFLEETHGRDLSRYSWQHPFLGHLNFYEWFTFVGAHQIRHSKQMWEIGQNLPKGVASSWKEKS